MAGKRRKSGAKTGFDRPPEGKIRRSQVITTYGPGAMVDLVDDAVMIWGLDEWRFDGRFPVIEEQRLRERLAPRMKSHGIHLAQTGYFRAPPEGDDKNPRWNRAIKSTAFPRWMVCQDPGCRRLIRSDNLERRQGRYAHDCRKPNPFCVPVRFVAACENGHLEEFPWVWFAHSATLDQKICAAPALTLVEGMTGDFSGVRVKCACGMNRPLVDAKLESRRNPLCKGRRPWLGKRGTEDTCEHRLKLMVRTASNAYFSVTESALSIPEEESKLHDVVGDHWNVLQAATRDTLPAFRLIPAIGAALEPWSNDLKVLEAVVQIKAGTKPPREEIRRAEFKRLTGEAVYQQGDLPAPEGADFYARKVPKGHFKVPLPAGVASVTLAYKLREVRVQLGFTRFSSMPRNMQGETGANNGGRVKMALLGLDTDWLPAVEIRGEGIFIQLDEAAVSAWEKRPAVRAWGKELRDGFEAWSLNRGGGGEFPGVRFFLLHSLSHLLITQLSLECGYAASSIKERIYCDGTARRTKMAAILLSTGTPGTEGTLGGLVEEGRRLGHHLRRAVQRGELCSNDPVCAQHSPADDLAERHLDGAACYACLFVAESSCEWFNQHLDRSVVVPVVGQPSERAFFGRGAFNASVAPRVTPEPTVAREVMTPTANTKAASTQTEESGWAELRRECVFEGAEETLQALENAGRALPDLGEEIAGLAVELSWPEAKVALVEPVAVSNDDMRLLTGAGWRVHRAPVELEALLRDLSSGSGPGDR